MNDKTFDGYISEFEKIISKLNTIADDVEKNAEGIGEENCQKSIKDANNSLKNILDKIKAAYQNDLLNPNN